MFFFYPVEEEEYKILVLIVLGMFKIAKRASKRKNVGIGINEWIYKDHIPSQI